MEVTLKTKLSWLICVLLSVGWLLPVWQAAAQAAPTPTPAQAQSTLTQVRITQKTVEGKNYPQVKLIVSVTDNAGQPVTGLDAGAFSVIDNQEAKTVKDKSLSVKAIQPEMAIGFVIDSSHNFAQKAGALSLAEHARQVINDWAVVSATEHLKKGDRLALYAFKDGIPSDLTLFKPNNINDLSNGLQEVSTENNNNTALFDVVGKSIVDALAQPMARRALVIFSDGIDTISSYNVTETIQRAKDANLVIYTVGMSPGFSLAPDQASSKFLRRLAQETGGEYIWYRPTVRGARVQLDEFLQRVDNQRNLYELTYDTTQCLDKSNVYVVVQSDSTRAESSHEYYDIPQHKPRISLEELVKDRTYPGTRELIKANVTCEQSPLTKVEFKINGQVEYTDPVEPFEYDWDTDASAKRLGFAENDPRPVTVTAVGYAGTYAAEDSRTVRIQPKPISIQVPPCTTGNFFQNLLCELQSGNSLAYLNVVFFIVIVAMVVLFIVFVRRGGMRAVGQKVVEEARRVTKTFQHKTRIKGRGGAIVRPTGLATLILESEPYTGKRIYMEETNAYIGRVPEKADIVFEWDDYISGRHAKIKCDQGRFFVWDMQSANGTWVNDQRVPKSMSDGIDYNEARELFDGSIIRLGPDLRLRFKPGTEQEVAAPAAAPIAPPAQPPATGAAS